LGTNDDVAKIGWLEQCFHGRRTVNGGSLEQLVKTAILMQITPGTKGGEGMDPRAGTTPKAETTRVVEANLFDVVSVYVVSLGQQTHCPKAFEVRR